jgi:hypothetical protein
MRGNTICSQIYEYSYFIILLFIFLVSSSILSLLLIIFQNSKFEFALN